MTTAQWLMPELHVRDNTKATMRKPAALLGKRTIPDADILAMRRMYQVERKTLRQVQRAFADVCPRYIARVLVYEVRAQPHLLVNGGRL